MASSVPDRPKRIGVAIDPVVGDGALRNRHPPEFGHEGVALNRPYKSLTTSEMNDAAGDDHQWLVHRKSGEATGGGRLGYVLRRRSCGGQLTSLGDLHAHSIKGSVSSTAARTTAPTGTPRCAFFSCVSHHRIVTHHAWCDMACVFPSDLT